MKTTSWLGIAALAAGIGTASAHACPACAAAAAAAKEPAKPQAAPAAGEAAAAPVIKPQTLCPVMGKAINRNFHIDHAGKRIYVCCQGCIEPVRKDPAKYIKALEEAGITLETVTPDAPAKADGAKK